MEYTEIKTYKHSPEVRAALAQVQREVRARKKAKLTLQGPAAKQEPCKADSSHDGGAPC